MKYYLFSIHDSRNVITNYSRQPLNSINTTLDKILKSTTNGYCKILFNNSFIIKSNQNIKYWKDLILSNIDRIHHSYFIVELFYDNFIQLTGYIEQDVVDWLKLEKLEREKTTCKNSFEIESCK